MVWSIRSSQKNCLSAKRIGNADALVRLRRFMRSIEFKIDFAPHGETTRAIFSRSLEKNIRFRYYWGRSI